MLPTPGSTWQHSKRKSIYTIIEVKDGLVIYCEKDRWQDYQEKRKTPDEQIQIWARDIDQWLDEREVDGQKTTRFVRLD